MRHARRVNGTLKFSHFIVCGTLTSTRLECFPSCEWINCDCVFCQQRSASMESSSGLFMVGSLATELSWVWKFFWKINKNLFRRCLTRLKLLWLFLSFDTFLCNAGLDFEPWNLPVKDKPIQSILISSWHLSKPYITSRSTKPCNNTSNNLSSAKVKTQKKLIFVTFSQLDGRPIKKHQHKRIIL